MQAHASAPDPGLLLCKQQQPCQDQAFHTKVNPTRIPACAGCTGCAAQGDSEQCQVSPASSIHRPACLKRPAACCTVSNPGGIHGGSSGRGGSHQSSIGSRGHDKGGSTLQASPGGPCSPLWGAWDLSSLHKQPHPFTCLKTACVSQVKSLAPRNCLLHLLRTSGLDSELVFRPNLLLDLCSTLAKASLLGMPGPCGLSGLRRRPASTLQAVLSAGLQTRHACAACQALMPQTIPGGLLAPSLSVQQPSCSHPSHA